ncbi:MAG TPA: hypothetical protein PLA91_01985 [Bacillota bacterium]|nr:hypothetical protein [Bacillota bacterium]
MEAPGRLAPARGLVEGACLPSRVLCMSGRQPAGLICGRAFQVKPGPARLPNLRVLGLKPAPFRSCALTTRLATPASFGASLRGRPARVTWGRLNGPAQLRDPA